MARVVPKWHEALKKTLKDPPPPPPKQGLLHSRGLSFRSSPWRMVGERSQRATERGWWETCVLHPFMSEQSESCWRRGVEDWTPSVNEYLCQDMDLYLAATNTGFGVIICWSKQTEKIPTLVLWDTCVLRPFLSGQSERRWRRGVEHWISSVN